MSESAWKGHSGDQAAIGEREGIRARASAELLDLGIAFVLFFGIGAVAGALGGAWAAAIAGALVGLAYSGLEVIKGATPGKMILGLRICSEDGSPASRRALLKRWALKQAPGILRLLAALTALSVFQWLGLLVWGVLALGFLLVLKPGRQTLHDLMTRTAVYRAG